MTLIDITKFDKPIIKNIESWRFERKPENPKIIVLYLKSKPRNMVKIAEIWRFKENPETGWISGK